MKDKQCPISSETEERYEIVCFRFSLSPLSVALMLLRTDFQLPVNNRTVRKILAFVSHCLKVTFQRKGRNLVQQETSQNTLVIISSQETIIGGWGQPIWIPCNKHIITTKELCILQMSLWMNPSELFKKEGHHYPKRTEYGDPVPSSTYEFCS